MYSPWSVLILFLFLAKRHMDAIGMSIAQGRGGIRAKVVPKNPSAGEMNGWDISNKAFRDIFLREYWQKRPLLIRKAIDIPGKMALVGADVLDLCMDEDVESRIVSAGGVKRYGPFKDEDLSSIPPKDWTILVQEVDRHVPAMADLWDDFFSFVPSWRRDDVMVSYSKPGGGIGAHVDNYDVFLVQGGGRRRWSIENVFLTHDEEHQRERIGCETRLLERFRADESWELEAGDMLYLPARVPHEGVALSDDCVTVSMGFRAPSFRSLITAATAHICDGLGEEQFLSDACVDQIGAAHSPGRLMNDVSCMVRDEISGIIGTVFHGADAECTTDPPDSFADWLGEYMTVPLRMHLSEANCFYVERPELSGPADELAPQVKVDGTVAGDSDFGFDLDTRFINVRCDDTEDFEEESMLPLSVRHPKFRVASSRIWGDVESVLNDAIDGVVALRLLEGTRICYNARNIFINGEVFPLPQSPQDDPNRYAFVGSLLCDRRVISPSRLRECTSGHRQTAFTRLLMSLMRAGYYYPVEIDGVDHD
mgnify:CR=1 FL=1